MWTWNAPHLEIPIMNWKWDQKRKGVKEGEVRERERKRCPDVNLFYEAVGQSDYLHGVCLPGPRWRRFIPGRGWFDCQGVGSWGRLMASSLADLTTCLSHVRNSKFCLKYLSPCHLYRRSERNPWSLALAWTGAGCFSHLGIEPVDRRYISLSLFLSFPPSYPASLFVTLLPK